MNFLPQNIESGSDSDDEQTPYSHETPVEEIFLSKCHSKTDVNVFSPVLGSFNVEGDNIKKLFSMLNKNYKEIKTKHFAEKQTEKSGLMLDFDMYQTSPIQQVSNSHIEKLVLLISKALNKFVKFEEFDSFHVAVIRRPLVIDAANPSKMILKYCQKKSLYKDGLHVLIPEIMMSRTEKRCLNQYLLSEITNNDIFSDVIFENSKHDPILDMASSHVPVFFVGSIKPNKEQRGSYPLSFVWEIETYDDADIEMKKINLKKVMKYNIPL